MSGKEVSSPMHFIVAVIIGFIRSVFGRGNKY
nr:MAG TPA: hypothetical protein [Caudoviricetes sp.]